MRYLAAIADETSARRFGAYLKTAGMANTVEPGREGWAMWVHDEDQLGRAQAELQEYLSRPDAPRYSGVEKAARVIVAAQEKRQQQRARNHIDVRTSWHKMAVGHRRFVLTTVLLLACGVVGVATQLGDKTEPLLPWLWLGLDGGPLEVRDTFEMVLRGQVWRLITPIFIHYGVMHFVFNMFWLWDLGTMIETRKGALRLGTMVLVMAVISNALQGVWSGPGAGGMSGVIYGLFGYVWIKSRLAPQEGMALAHQSVVIMFVWLFACMTGFFGPIGNAAHVAGLVVGMAWAYLPYGWRRIRRRIG